MEKISVRTLGTGAADHHWKKIGNPGVRGSCTTLIDNRILVDYGVTGKENLARFNIDPGQIRYLFITHCHIDHCDPVRIGAMLESRQGCPLHIIADRAVLKDIKKYSSNFVPHPAKPGQTLVFDGFEATPAPANHSVPKGTPLHYLFDFSGKTLFYALDGAWITTPERRIIGKRKLDMILWDGTIGIENDYRIFEHNDLRMLKMMYEVLKSDGVATRKTIVLLDHLARTLWPESQKDCEKLVPRKWKVASDGAAFFF